MQDSSPLFSLTVAEYKALNQEILAAQLKHWVSLLNKNPVSETDLIFINDVEKITGYSKATIYKKVCNLEIPILSRNKPLTFSKAEIEDWIRQGKPDQKSKIIAARVAKRKKA